MLLEEGVACLELELGREDEDVAFDDEDGRERTLGSGEDDDARRLPPLLLLLDGILDNDEEEADV